MIYYKSIIFVQKCLFVTCCLFLIMWSTYGRASTNVWEDVNNNVLSLVISGIITDETGQAMPGVTIRPVGTVGGTISDETGHYAIDVPATVTQLEFSFVGYETRLVAINNRTIIDISLQPDSKTLDDLVVVGYGVEQKKLLTGSMGIVSSEDLKNLPTPGIDGILQGQSAGIQVVQNSGTPGAENSVRIRGVSSIGGSSQPLYVIDGIPVTTGDFGQVGYSGQGINALSDISPDDIESISILKDAAAASIYGARASNGVVLITTKRGKDQKSTISFNANYGLQQAWRQLDMLNARDWKLYRNDLAGTEVFSPAQIADNSIDTDWQDVIFRTAPMSNFDLSATGGNEKTKYYLGGNLFDQTGILIGTDYRRINGRVNIDHKLTDKVNIGTSVGLSYAKTNRVESDQTLHGPLPNGISTPAIFPVYNDDNSYNQNGPYSNAVSIANEATNQNFSNRAIGNVYLDYRIFKGLTFSTKWGIDFINFREHAYDNILTVQGARYNGLGFETFTNVSNLVSNNTLRYNFEVGKQNLEVLGGYSFEKREARSAFIRAQDFADPNLEYINSASTIVSASSGASDSGIRSFFGRANYNFDNKYIVSLSGRLDGSTRFSDNNKNGFFPAISAAWRISQESFFNVGGISELKLRASYGLTGNDDIPAFLYAELYGNTSYAGQPAIYPSNIPNPDLRWETTAQADIGLDIGLAADRFLITLDVYHKKTTDLLLSRPLPGSSGFSAITENIGEVENKGLEVSLSSDNLRNSRLRWNTRLNFSMNRNKVLKLYNGQAIDDLGRGGNRIEEGEPIGIFYNYEWLGVDPSTGDVVYKDVNYDGVINSSDRTKIGNPHPDCIYGITNTLSMLGFDLNFFFQGSYGNDVMNGSRLYLESLQGGDNQLAAINRRWKQVGDITDIPRATNDPNSASLNRRLSSRFLEDGSYVRLKNLTVGYSFDRNKIFRGKISALRLFVSAQNLLTFTNYGGLDPEVNYRGDDNAVIGTDFFTYPQAKSFSFGINTTF